MIVGNGNDVRNGSNGGYIVGGHSSSSIVGGGGNCLNLTSENQSPPVNTNALTNSSDFSLSNHFKSDLIGLNGLDTKKENTSMGLGIGMEMDM